MTTFVCCFSSAEALYDLLKTMDVSKPPLKELLFPIRAGMIKEQQAQENPVAAQGSESEEKKENEVEASVQGDNPYQLQLEFQANELDAYPTQDSDSDDTIEDGMKKVLNVHGLKPKDNLDEGTLNPTPSPSPKRVRQFSSLLLITNQWNTQLSFCWGFSESASASAQQGADGARQGGRAPGQGQVALPPQGHHGQEEPESQG
jgi:hypothetical protein